MLSVPDAKYPYFQVSKIAFWGPKQVFADIKALNLIMQSSYQKYGL